MYGEKIIVKTKNTKRKCIIVNEIGSNAILNLFSDNLIEIGERVDSKRIP